MDSTSETFSQDPKLRLLEAGVRLMSEKGCNATSIGDICEAAKINKGSFYYYFKDKLTFTQSALEYFWDTNRNCVAEGCFKNINEPLERLKARSIVKMLKPRRHGVELGTRAL